MTVPVRLGLFLAGLLGAFAAAYLLAGALVPGTVVADWSERSGQDAHEGRDDDGQDPQEGRGDDGQDPHGGQEDGARPGDEDHGGGDHDD